MMRYYLTLILLAWAFSFCKAQDSVQAKKPKSKFEPNTAVIIAVNYTAQFPFGHVSQRFGFNSLFSAQISFKSKKNWLIGANGGLLYGTKVKQDYVVNGIATSTGQFITQYNDLTSLKLGELGYNVQFTFGKIIPFVEQYPDAGLLFMTGFGIVQDKIAINVRTIELPQFSPAYKKGYDRMNNGPVLSQFIGGTFMARRKYVSGYLGAQIDVSYTENRRPYDFYAMQKLDDKGFDVFIGIRAGWIIPIFLQTSAKEFFYY